MYVVYVDSNPVAKPSRDPLTKKYFTMWSLWLAWWTNKPVVFHHKLQTVVVN